MKQLNASKQIGKDIGNKKVDEAVKLNSVIISSITSGCSPVSVHPGLPIFGSALVTTHGSSSAVQGEHTASDNQLAGYIFMCNGETKPECFRFRVFGLPAARIGVVAKIKPNTKLFLFDFSLKLLYGVYVACSNGNLGLEPTAFGGKFPAQVKFEILADCLPLPESAFKHVIRDNYVASNKFRQEISNEQVNNLISMFRPIAVVRPVPFTQPLINRISPRSDIEQVPLSAPSDHYASKVQLARLRGLALDAQQAWVPSPKPPPLFDPHRAARLVKWAQAQPVLPSQNLQALSPEAYRDPYYLAERDLTSLSRRPCIRYIMEDGRENFPPPGAQNEFVNHDFAVSAINSPLEAPSIQLQTPASILESSQIQAPSFAAAMQVPSLPSLPAAYWTAVASRDANVYYSHYQGQAMGNADVRQPDNNGKNGSVLPSISGNVSYAHEQAVAATNACPQTHVAQQLQLPERPHTAQQLQLLQQPHGVEHVQLQEHPHAAEPAQIPEHPHAAQQLQLQQESYAAAQQWQLQQPSQAAAQPWQLQQKLHEQSHIGQQLQQQVPAYVPAYYPSSSLTTTYWANVASVDPNNVYSGSQQGTSIGGCQSSAMEQGHVGDLQRSI